MSRSATALALAAALAVLAVGCGGPRRFSTASPMWRDAGDFEPFAPMPARYSSPAIWDTADNLVFGPLSRALAVEQSREAVDVNAVDEVPDSSWFTNRLGRAPMPREELVRGACHEDPLTIDVPWTVVGGKPNGANPGFLIELPSGERYLIKPDRYGERASSADVIGSIIYHAAGFNVPCNQVLFVPPEILRIGEGAMAEDFVGDKVPFVREMLDAVFEDVLRDDAGRYRVMASRYLDGKPLGPWVDFGIRPDDPNDVIDHEERRELRGSYVLAAWLDHYDAREQNSLDMWIQVDPGAGSGWVKHYFIDFGDCLGSMSAWPRVARRRGVAYEIDFGVALVEMLTFGLLDRPWQHARVGAAGKTLGYFDARRFDPGAWRTAYPYGPFTRTTERDAAWMARIVARISPEDVAAIVDQAKLRDRKVRDELVRILRIRRERLLRRYLGRLSPLTEPTVTGDQVCLRDAAVEAGIADGPKQVCAPLEPGGGYQIVELRARRTRPIRVHLSGGRVVGLER